MALADGAAPLLKVVRDSDVGEGQRNGGLGAEEGRKLSEFRMMGKLLPFVDVLFD